MAAVPAGSEKAAPSLKTATSHAMVAAVPASALAVSLVAVLSVLAI